MILVYKNKNRFFYLFMIIEEKEKIAFLGEEMRLSA